MNEGNYDLAELLFLKSLDMMPVNPATKLYLSRIYLLKGKITEAEEQLSSILGLFPNNINVIKELLKLYELHPELDIDNLKRVKLLEKQIELEPNNIDTMLKLAEAYISLNKDKKAEEILLNCIPLQPANIKVRILLAELYATQGKEELVEDMCSTIIGLDPNNTEVKKILEQTTRRLSQYNTAMELMRQRKYNDAEKHLTNMRRENRKNEFIYCLLRRTICKTGNKETNSNRHISSHSCIKSR